MIIVNFKLYKETFGDGAIKLAKICKEVMEETGVKIIPAVSALDAVRIKRELEIDVFIQNIDDCIDGAKSGYISPVQASELGINGSLLNHSEHQIPIGKIRSIVKKIPEDFKIIVCTNSLGKIEKIINNKNIDYIAYEPSYLIGDKTRSVASEKPELIKKMAEKSYMIPILVGAGIHNKHDIEVSLSLGAKGVLVSSGIVKAADQKVALMELASGFLI